MPADTLVKRKYRILREVGRGGMGTVYEVVHETLGSRFALKQLRLDLSAHAEIANRFRHEAQIMARLQHPHIVRVFDIDSEDGFGPYILMEFISGRDLGKIIRQSGRLDYSEVIRISSEVASALETAHRAGLVHRDIKPANILIEDGSNRAVVTDFGIAKQVEADSDDSATRTGSFLGTYRYSSPEQIRNDKKVRLDGRADIYSLGAVMYEMYAGKRFLEGLPELEIAGSVGFQAGWKPPLEFPEPPPADFQTLVEQCLRRDRDARPATAAEVLTRLGQCLPAPKDKRADLFAAEIRDLREEVTARLAEYRTLCSGLAALGLPTDALASADSFSGRLREIEHLEREGKLASAAANSEHVNDELARANAAAAAELQRASEQRLAELRAERDHVRHSTRGFVSEEQHAEVEAAIESLDTLVSRHDWPAWRSRLDECRLLLRRERETAGRHAEEVVRDLFRQIAGHADELRQQAPADAAVHPDFAALEAETAAELSAGRLHEARRRAEEALEMVTASLARVVLERQAATAARAEADRLRNDSEIDAARMLAAEELDRAERAWAHAQEAERRSDFSSAAAAYRDAQARYRAAYDRASEQRKSELSAAHRELVALIRAAEGVSPEIVGRARIRAQAVLKASAPHDLRAAIADAHDAGAKLAAAVQEAGPFAEAAQARDQAERGVQAARAVGATAAQLEEPNRLVAAGAAAFRQRQWPVARDRYHEAARALAALNETLVQAAAAPSPAATMPAPAPQDDAPAPDGAMPTITAVPEAAPARTTRWLPLAAVTVAAIAAALLVARMMETPVDHRTEEERAAPLAPEPPRTPRIAAIAVPARITAASPETKTVALRENTTQTFSVTIDRGKRETPAAIEWRLDGTVVATNTPEWVYRPGFDAAGPSHRVEIRLDAGKEADQVHRWDVRVDDVNRPPIVRSASPKPDTTIQAHAGDTVDFALDAADEDEDPLRYEWSVDGAPVREAGPSMKVPVTGDHRVDLAIHDGKGGTAAATWRIAAIPLPARIAAASPGTKSVAVQENVAQTFSVTIDRGQQEKPPATEWQLDGTVVATDTTEWVYRPGFDAAGPSHRVEIRLDAGKEADQVHRWDVRVDDVNRPPIVRSASPKPDTTIQAHAGDTVDFALDAADEDEDPLRYEWSVDGAPVREAGPSMKVPVTGDHRVELAIHDGKDGTATTAWRIAAIPLPPLRLDVQPSQLEAVRFKDTKEFKLVAPRELRNVPIRYSWAVDDRVLHDGPTFALRDYREDMVRESPVTIRATATDPQGRTFTHEWRVRVLPPAPEIKSSSPAKRTLEVDIGAQETFRLEALPPVGSQSLVYVFTVDGKAVPSPKGEYELSRHQDGTQEVIATVQDNYGQKSAPIIWRIDVPLIRRKVTEWFTNFSQAWQRKDARRVGELWHLSPTRAERLEKSFRDKHDYRASFRDTRVRVLDGGQQARLSYQRDEQWVGAADRKRMATSVQVEHAFRLVGDSLKEVSHKSRPLGESPEPVDE